MFVLGQMTLDQPQKRDSANLTVQGTLPMLSTTFFRWARRRSYGTPDRLIKTDKGEIRHRLIEEVPTILLRCCEVSNQAQSLKSWNVSAPAADERQAPQKGMRRLEQPDPLSERLADSNVEVGRPVVDWVRHDVYTRPEQLSRVLEQLEARSRQVIHEDQAAQGAQPLEGQPEVQAGRPTQR